MRKDFTPWEYRKGCSFLHRLPGGLKLVGLLVLSTGAFFLGPSGIFFLALFVFILALCANIKPWELLRGSLPLVFFVFAVFIIGALDFKQGINRDAVITGFIFSLRIAVSFSAGALFFRVCTMKEVRNALGFLENFIPIKKLYLGLSLSLMLAFMPRFFSIWEELNLAWKSKAGGAGIKKLSRLIPVLIESLMEKAAEISLALESRGL